MAESRQPDALKRLQEKGVTLHRWPDETLEVLRNAWNEVVKEEAAKDEDFAKVWASLSSFRESYKVWKDLGFVDSWRILNPNDSSTYSWFDYRSRMFDQNPKRGLRIDHIMLSENLKDSIISVGIDHVARAMEKPSDHCPIWLELNE